MYQQVKIIMSVMSVGTFNDDWHDKPRHLRNDMINHVPYEMMTPYNTANRAHLEHKKMPAVISVKFATWNFATHRCARHLTKHTGVHDT